MATATLRAVETPSIEPSIVALPLMERFHEIVDAAAILCTRSGIYRQAKVFRKGNEVYAGYGGGFIRLSRNGNTSTPTMHYVGLDLAGQSVSEDRLGRLILGGANG